MLDIKVAQVPRNREKIVTAHILLTQARLYIAQSRGWILLGFLVRKGCVWLCDLILQGIRMNVRVFCKEFS